MLPRRQSQVALDCVRGREASPVVQGSREAKARDRTDPRHRHQALADRIFLRELLELLVRCGNLLVQGIH